ncbi:MAG: hypothetical protein WAV72_25810 [Bradyrhizobium sp.]
MAAIIVAAQGQESPIGQRRASAHPRRRRHEPSERRRMNSQRGAPIGARARPKTSGAQIAISMSGMVETAGIDPPRW